MSEHLTRAMSVQVRGVDKEARTAEFVASTETPVDMGWGEPEVLRASGCQMDRYRANPVVLNSHRRNGVEDIVGQAVEIKAEGRQVVMRVRYDDDEYGERAWRKVQSGSLRAVSVGYRPSKVLDVREGATDGEGESEVRGPATVVTEWELLEVSMVPVPADPNALKRAYRKEASVAKPTKPGKAREDAPPADDEDEDEEKAEAPADEKAEGEEDDEDEEPADEAEKALVAAKARFSRDQLDAHREHLLTFCPPDLREFAEGPRGPLADHQLWDELLPVADFKRALREERKSRSHGAVGTPAVTHTTGATTSKAPPAPAAPVTTTATTERKALGRSLIQILKGA